MENKKCSKCGVCKSIESFYFKDKRKGTTDNKCKECRRKYFKKYYRAMKDESLERYWNRRKVAKNFVENYLKTHPCVDCGNGNAIVLEFDHVAGEKKAGINQMVHSGYPPSTIAKEIDKCEVRCANCHRIRHNKNRWGTTATTLHGTRQ